MWDKKYRPLKFSDVLGQTGAVLALKARLRRGTALDTNYIFAGGHGQGKTTLARIMARAMLCTNLDKNDPEPCNACDNCKDILNDTSNAFKERDAASQGGVNDLREIVDDLPFAVLGAPKRISLFDEAHRMSKDGQDVLLKPLEEGTKLVAILCTTEPDKIRGAIKSRCEGGIFVLRKVTRDDILERLRTILAAEGVPFEDDAVLTVIDHSGGHVRDVLNRLEMISQLGGITLANTQEYLNLGVVSLYYEILLALGDTGKAIQLVEQACDRAPPEDVATGLAEAAMNSYRLAQGMHADFVYVDREKAKQVWEKFGVGCVDRAEFLTRSRNPSRISMICDVARLSGGTVPTPQPHVVSIPQQLVAAPPAPSLTPPPVVALAPDTPVVQAVTAAAPIPPPAPTKPPVQASSPSMKGALGSADPQALTDDDPKAIPRVMPRRPHAEPPPLVFGGSTDEDQDLMSPEDWRQEFERTFKLGLG